MTDTKEVLPMHIAALSYAKRGIPVFPLFPKGTTNAVKWDVDATTDQDQIDKWWTKNPAYNIGIVTGEKSGIVVVVFLTPEAWAIGLERGLPVTPVVEIGKEHHVYCRYQGDADYSLKGACLQGIDLRSDGRFVIASPSILVQYPGTMKEKADIYSWADGKGLDNLELADVPEWLLEPKEVDEGALSDPIPATVEGDVNLSESESTMGIKEITLSAGCVELPVMLNTKIEPPISEGEVLEALEGNSEQGSEPLPLQVADWKAPVLFEGIGVEEIKADLLPSWLGEYAGAISESKQTPEGMAVMLGLSIVATCVQKKFEVAPYGDAEYTEQLSLWTATVLKSGERKSPVLNAMRAPIVAWQKEQTELLKPLMLETSIAINVAQKRIEKLQQDAAKEADTDKRQGIVDQIYQIKTSVPVEVKAPSLWTADVTAEALQDLLAENDERMALLTDEGNIFEIMAGLYNDGKVNIDIFLQAYSGSPTKIMRKTRKVDLHKPALTFGLAVQPVVIESFATGSKKQFRGKGALGRFLFCIPESMLGKRVAGRRAPIAAEVKSRYEEGIKGLLSVPKTFDDAGKEVPRMLMLEDEAICAWEEFDARVEIMIGPGGELEAMDDWGAKLPGTALRIAGLLHLVEYGTGNNIIGKDTLDRAIHLCDLLIGHTKAVFGLIGVDEPVSDAKKIFMWMKERGFVVFTRTECNKENKNLDKGRLDNALKELQERNVLKELMIPTGGRDAANYVSNPSLKPIVG